MEFYHYLNDYFFLNVFENSSIEKFFKNTSLDNLINVYFQTLSLPKTTFFTLNYLNTKKNIFINFDFSNCNIFDFSSIYGLSNILDKESKINLLNNFCHYLVSNLPFFWFLDKNEYLKNVCFSSTGTYFNTIGKDKKVTNDDKKKFFGSFLRNEVVDLVIDKYWEKPIVFFLRKNLYFNKTYFSNTNIVNYVFNLIYKSYIIEINKVPSILIGVYNLYFFLNKNYNILNLNNLTSTFDSFDKFLKIHKNVLKKKNYKNIQTFIYLFSSELFKEYYKLFYVYSLKKYSLEELSSILPFLKKYNLIPSTQSQNFKNFFLYNNSIYGYSPVFFSYTQPDFKNLSKILIKTETFYKNSYFLTAFQNYNLKGVEVNRFKSFFKNYFVSNTVKNITLKFEKLFKFLKIKFFTSHFSEHLPKKKTYIYDSTITFYKWKIFVKKKMPYFFDGPWMSVPLNKIGRHWITYIVNNISDYWFLKNKNYLNKLHFALFGYSFPSKKKLTVKMLRKFYANYIYTVSKFKLNNCTIYNPYVKLLNKFYLSPKVMFYLVNTEDNFGRFFEEYYYGHNKQLLYVFTSLLRQEFAIANSFLLKNLNAYANKIKHQNKNFYFDNEDYLWDLNLSGGNSLYSGKTCTDGLHLFVSYLYEDFFRELVYLDNSSVPVQEKCKSDSLFFHTFTWDKLEPLD